MVAIRGTFADRPRDARSPEEPGRAQFPYASDPAARVKRQVCRGQEGTTSPLPRSLIRHCCGCSPPRACAGVRRWALRWSDVDLTNGLLRVRGTLLRVNGHLVISEPKTERSRRNVPLSPADRGALGRVKASQAGERVKAASTWVEAGLVFITESGDGSRPQERTAGDQHRGQGFGHQRCRPAQVEARHAHARGRRATAYRLGATRALLRRSHRRRVRPPSTEGVFSAVQRLSAAMGW